MLNEIPKCQMLKPLTERQRCEIELPFGVGKSEDGRDVFFNARCEAFLLRDVDGRLEWVAYNEQVKFTPRYYFYDLAENPPWKDSLVKRMLKLLVKNLWSHRMA